MTRTPSTHRPRSSKGEFNLNDYRVSPSASHIYHLSLLTYSRSRFRSPLSQPLITARVHYRRARSTLLSSENTTDTRNVRFCHAATVENATVKRIRSILLASQNADKAAGKKRKSVAFAPSIPDHQPRHREHFRRRSSIYTPGRHADRSGHGFYNTNDPFKEESSESDSEGEIELPQKSDEDEEMEDEDEEMEVDEDGEREESDEELRRIIKAGEDEELDQLDDEDVGDAKRALLARLAQFGKKPK